MDALGGDPGRHVGVVLLVVISSDLEHGPRRIVIRVLVGVGHPAELVLGADLEVDRVVPPAGLRPDQLGVRIGQVDLEGRPADLRCPHP